MDCRCVAICSTLSVLVSAPSLLDPQNHSKSNASDVSLDSWIHAARHALMELIKETFGYMWSTGAVDMCCQERGTVAKYEDHCAAASTL